jgi:hypothetical protein
MKFRSSQHCMDHTVFGLLKPRCSWADDLQNQVTVMLPRVDPYCSTLLLWSQVWWHMSSLGKEHRQEPDDSCKVFASACKLSPGLNISYLKPLAFYGEFLLPPHLSQTSHIWFDMYNLFWNKNVATAMYPFCSHQHKSDSTVCLKELLQKQV